jgi:hypothetical protein
MIKNDVSPLYIIVFFWTGDQPIVHSRWNSKKLILIFILLVVVHHISWLLGLSGLPDWCLEFPALFLLQFPGKEPKHNEEQDVGGGNIDGGGGGAVGATVVDGSSCESNAGHFNLQQGKNLLSLVIQSA